MELGPTVVFLVLGLALMVLELVVPGLVLVFLGAAALLVAGALYVGLLGGWIAAFTAWFVTSIALVLGLRSAFTRFLPGTSTKQLTDEDIDAFGEVATVVDKVTPSGGRIRFRGTTWVAQTVDETLPGGSKVRIVSRDNLSWIVEPLQGWEALEESMPAARLAAGAKEKGET